MKKEISNLFNMNTPMSETDLAKWFNDTQEAVVQINKGIKRIGINNMHLTFFKKGPSLKNSNYYIFINRTDPESNQESALPIQSLKCIDGSLSADKFPYSDAKDISSFALEEAIRQIATVFYIDQENEVTSHFQSRGESIPKDMQNKLDNAKKDINQLATNILIASNNPLFPPDSYYEKFLPPSNS